MFETLQKPKKIAAVGVAAGALALGIGASKAEATPVHNQEAAAAATNPEQRKSIEDLTQQTAEHLLSGQAVNYYRGSVEIVDTKTSQQKANIIDPIVVYRYGASSKEVDFAINHPRSKFWAIGYIQHDVEGNLGNGNLVLLPFNNNGKNFKFHKEGSKVPDNRPAVDVVGFIPLKGGGLDLDQPVDFQTMPLYDNEHQPLPVGLIMGPGGKGADTGIQGKGGDPSAEH